MSSSEIPEVFSSVPMSIDGYVEKIQDKYIIHNHLMSDFNVLQVDHFKTNNGPQHEYISATVEGPNGDIYHLAIERFGGEPINKQGDVVTPPDAQIEEAIPVLERSQVQASSPRPSPRRPELKLANSSTSSLASLDSPSTPPCTPRSLYPKRHANDMVTLMKHERRFKEDSLKKSLTMEPTKRLPLFELAILALAVHIDNGLYAAFKGNCYLYAGTLFNVVKQVYEAEPAGGKGKAGTWHKVPVTSPGEIDARVGPVREIFQEELAKFLAKIDEKRAAVMAELLPESSAFKAKWEHEAMLRQEEEERHRQEEERRKQEEERRMEDAERRIKELEAELGRVRKGPA